MGRRCGSSSNEGKREDRFLRKNIFSYFGVQRTIISDEGSHFFIKMFWDSLAKYRVNQYEVVTPYHPQTSGKVKVPNREIKTILSKVVDVNKSDWSRKLDYALWSYQTTFKTPIGIFPYKLDYGKSCHLPVVLEHKALWALKKLNLS